MRRLTNLVFFRLRLGFYLLGLYWLVIFAGTHLPKPPVIVANVSDKTEHFVAFFVLALLMCYVTTSRRLIRRFGTIIGVALAYAAVDELTQILVPNRTADVWDFVADACGVFSGVAVYTALRSVYYRYFPHLVRPAPEAACDRDPTTAG